MTPTRIENAHETLGQPRDWKPDADGPCVGLPVRYERHGNIRYTVSAWEPSPDELLAIKRGAKVHLFVSAPIHPVVFLGVGAIPGMPEPVEGLTYIDVNHELAQRVEVWDERKGVPFDRWIRAVNTQEGWADCYQQDPAGNVLTVDGDPRGEPLLQRVEGQFSIRWKQEPI